MKVLIDTNVCLDIIQNRHLFYATSKNAITNAVMNHKAYITTATVMDIMYITRKFFSDSKLQRASILNFISNFHILKVTQKDLNVSFLSSMSDFEDAVQANCARRNHIKLIVTRNVKDFAVSPVKAVLPEDFL